MVPQSGSELLPGWTLQYAQDADGIYNVTLADRTGRELEARSTDLADAILTVEEFAFDMERRAGENWEKFLFDYCRQQLHPQGPEAAHFNAEAGGSWVIQLDGKRLRLDGADQLLILQAHPRHSQKEWIDEEQLAISVLKLPDVKELLEAASR